MNATTATLGGSLLLLATACGQVERLSAVPVDCSLEDGYEFLNISNFSGTESGWFRYADPTPGGVPNPSPDAAVVEADPTRSSNVPVTELEPPGRCGDRRLIVLEVVGHNFWGAGFGDWAHNAPGSRADGTGYEGISFWARSARNAEKYFLFNVDDSRTIIMEGPAEGGATESIAGPGEVVSGTACRLPPPSELGEATCYNGGVSGSASAGQRVPAPDECGNSFHTRIATTEHWQLILIPWDELVQWPCPNRLHGGIDRANIAKFEIKMEQGMHYELWLDNIAFYRRRPEN